MSPIQDSPATREHDPGEPEFRPAGRFSLPEVTDEVLVYRALRTAAQRTVPGTAIYLVLFAVIVLSTSYHQRFPTLVPAMFAAFVVIGVWRSWLIFRFPRLYTRDPRAWKLHFIFAVIVNAAVWGTFWAFAITSDGLVPANTLAVMATVGIASASISTLAPIRVALLMFLVAMIAPLVWATLAVRAPEAYAVAFMAGAGLIFLISIGLRMNREFWTNLYRAQLLKERAAELALARDAAIAADQAKSDFLATMSHEIRTPLNGVLGMIEVLRGTELDRLQTRFAHALQQSAESLLIVIDDILDFSKIEAGKLELETCDFDLEELVDDTMELLTQTAAAKGLELLVDYSPDLGAGFRGDPNRLRQVLNNLVSNGVKFTEKGEVLVRVLPEHEGESSTLVRFEVHDTGIGLSPEAQEQIFERFYQAEGSTTRKYGGTGLGLAIAKEVAELMGGEIGVASEPGRWTRFWFTANLTRSAEDAGLAVAESLPTGRRILIVDNNASSRRILEGQMRGLSFSATLVGGGSEALKILETASADGRSFDLILLDRHMPELDGVEVARRLIRKNAGPSPPIIMLSPLGQLDCCPDGLDLAIFACVTKPVRRRELLKSVRDALGHTPTASGRVPESPSSMDTDSRLPTEILVLLVEDDEVNCIVAEEMLKSFGGQATNARSGKEAIDKATTGEFDIILMDCQMPEMDGYEATRRIRSHEQHTGRKPVPIVALTADASAGAREKAIQSGMNGFLNKPYHKAALRECLMRTLEAG